MINKPYGELSASYREGGTGGFYLRDARGMAKLGADPESALELEFSTNVGAGQPIIRCTATDRAVLISWEDLVELAIARGLLGIHCDTCAAVAQISPKGEPPEGWAFLGYSLGWACPSCLRLAMSTSVALTCQPTAEAVAAS